MNIVIAIPFFIATTLAAQTDHQGHHRPPFLPPSCPELLTTEECTAFQTAIQTHDPAQVDAFIATLSTEAQEAVKALLPPRIHGAHRLRGTPPPPSCGAVLTPDQCTQYQTAWASHDRAQLEAFFQTLPEDTLTALKALPRHQRQAPVGPGRHGPPPTGSPPKGGPTPKDGPPPSGHPPARRRRQAPVGPGHHGPPPSGDETPKPDDHQPLPPPSGIADRRRRQAPVGPGHPLPSGAPPKLEGSPPPSGSPPKGGPPPSGSPPKGGPPALPPKP